METLGNQIQQKSACKYFCNYCNYGTDRKCNYGTHLNSLKHDTKIKITPVGNQIQQKISKIQHFCEKCNKEFKNRSGLWKHNHKIHGPSVKNMIDSNYEMDDIDLKDKDAVIMFVLKQNSNLQKSLIEMSKEKSSITNTNSHNHSHNKTFNLNFFLNETCKDALNISDFVQTIKPSLEDLENTGRQGYIQGISQIILKNLKKLEDHNRPIHCSDSKREVMYIKDNNEWIKESEEKPILTKAIKVIAHENIKKINVPSPRSLVVELNH
jgi:hypothetical protein